MDLITAKDEAAKMSKLRKKKVYILIDKEGECDLFGAPLKGAVHCFDNGVEVPMPTPAEAKEEVKAFKKGGKSKKGVHQQPAQDEQTETATAETESVAKPVNKKSKTKMAKTAKAKPAKKATKKTQDRPAVKGVNKTLTVKAMLAEIKKGAKIYRKVDNAPLPEGYLAKMKDASREMEVTVVAAVKE